MLGKIKLFFNLNFFIIKRLQTAKKIAVYSLFILATYYTIPKINREGVVHRETTFEYHKGFEIIIPNPDVSKGSAPMYLKKS